MQAVHTHAQNGHQGTRIRKRAKSFYDSFGGVVCIPREGKADATFHVANVSKAITMLLNENAELAAITYAACAQSHFQELILYADEVVPGNVLKARNARKFVAYYAALACWETHLSNASL